MEEKKTNLEIIQQFAIVNLPGYSESTNTTKEIINWGDDNLWPKYIGSLLSKSAKHKAIVKTKAKLIGGRGFLRTNLNFETMMFLKNPLNRFDLEEILYRCALDLETFGGFSLNLIWNDDRTKIKEINFVSIAKLRVYKEDDGEGKKKRKIKPEKYFFSDGWENVNKYEPILYDGFSTINKKKQSQIWFLKDYDNNVEFYPQPSYGAAIRDIETDYLISDFHMNSIANGFSPAMMINWPAGSMTEEEKQQLVFRLRNQLENTPNANKTIFTFPDDISQKVTIDVIDLNTSDSRFLLLAERIESNILAAHEIPPTLANIKDIPGKLGSKNEKLESLEIFQNDYVTPKQQLLEKVFNKIARINGIIDNLIIKKYSDEHRRVESNVTDTLAILQAEMTAGQKYWMLVQSGLTHEIASKLSTYTEGNQPDKKPEKAPDINTPEKIGSTSGQPKSKLN
jgi:hypothetical protein